MTKYVCKICGYIYDPAEGHPEHRETGPGMRAQREDDGRDREGQRSVGHDTSC